MEVQTLIKSGTERLATRKTKHYQKIEKIFQSIIDEVVSLMKTFEKPEHRTYCIMDHTKNEHNSNMIKEFLCYFWNITLQFSPHKNVVQIVIDAGLEGSSILANEQPNELISDTLFVFPSRRLSNKAKNSLIINDQSIPMLDYYYSIIARGETQYISILSVEVEN